MAKTSWKKVNYFFLGILFLIVLIGFFLRVWNLDHYPVELHSQEALLGWRAKSLLLTGRDETGRYLPLIFSSFEGYQLPLASYLLIPFMKILGLTSLAVRLPFALIGTLVVPVFYGLVYLLFPKDRKMALWSAFFLAINPWSVWQSRVGLSSHLSFSLFLIGFFLLLLGRKKPIYYITSFLFLLFSLYTAKIAWFFVWPFLLFFCLWKRRKEVLLLIFLMIVFFFPLFFSYIKAPQARLDIMDHDLTLFSDISVANSLNLMRGEDIKMGLPLAGKLFYNKLFYGEKLFENFLKHFNPRFYFAAGDANSLHGLTNFGPVFLVFLPFALYGIWLIYKKEPNTLKLFFIWFILGTIPSVLSFSSPDQEKLIFVLPVLAITTGYCLSLLKKKYLFLLMMGLLVNLAVVSYDAFAKEPARTDKEWAYGCQKLTNFLKDKMGSYEKIFLTDVYEPDPGPVILFHLNYPPETFSNAQSKLLVYRNWINRVGHVFINQKDQWELESEILYIITPGEKEFLYSLGGEADKFKEEGIIYDFENKPIYLVFSYGELDKDEKILLK